MSRTIRQIPAFFSILICVTIVPFLPRRVVIGLAHLLGKSVYKFAPNLKKVGMANMNVVFGNSVTEATKEKWLEMSFVSFSLTVLDIFWFAFRTAARIKKYVKWNADFEGLMKIRPFIAISGHFGNWELLGRTISLMSGGCACVAMPVQGFFINWILNKLRSKCGEKIIRRKGAIKELIRELRAGRNVALVSDQNVVPRDGGIFMDFFGLPALTTLTPAQLAKKNGTPILVLFCVPDIATGEYEIHVNNPLCMKEKDDPIKMTNQIQHLFEDEIKKFPAYWLWSYKRWHYRRADDAATRFPYYTRILPADKDRRNK